jgi:hypothetical protein
MRRAVPGSRSWTKSPFLAYAFAAEYPVLKRILDTPELAAHWAGAPGTAHLHADGRFAGVPTELASSPTGAVAALEDEECESNELTLRIFERASDGDTARGNSASIPIRLGRWKRGRDDEPTFVETGVTVANRLLHDFGFTVVKDADEGMRCEKCEGDCSGLGPCTCTELDVRFFPRSKVWRVGHALRKAPPPSVTASQCREHSSYISDGPSEVYIPAVKRVFARGVAIRDCGDGGTDPVWWAEVEILKP